MNLANLRNKRLEFNLTQKKVAEYLGISDKHYSSMERGTRSISLVKANMLAELFNTTIEKLFIE
ncbi:helix-turn-helix domain-containing protein [Vallitalea guaymasensis]|uniref:helix-turn-helix transcriptional regulator n=1 Tax=Vallitalea guaymasensis TaxID=1185412 RepID=UPI000DE49632